MLTAASATFSSATLTSRSQFDPGKTMTAAFIGGYFAAGSTRKLAKNASIVSRCFSKSSASARATSR